MSSPAQARAYLAKLGVRHARRMGELAVSEALHDEPEAELAWDKAMQSRDAWGRAAVDMLIWVLSNEEVER